MGRSNAIDGADDYCAGRSSGDVGRSGNVGTGEVGTGNVGTGEVGTGEVGTDEVGTDEVGSNDVAQNGVAARGDSDTRHVRVEPTGMPEPADTPDADVPALSVAAVAASGGPSEPAAATGPRAGRNLPAAIGVGVLLAAAVAASLLPYRPSFVVVVCVAMAYGSFETVRAMSQRGIEAPLVPLLAGGLVMDAAAWFKGANGLALGLLITVAGILLWRLASGYDGFERDVGAAALVAVYVPLLGGFAVLLAHFSDGAGRVLAYIALVVCSDVGGYTAGVLFGRHPMAPAVSPKKSWEGFVGSVTACALAGALVVSLVFHHAWQFGVLFGLAIAVTATLGDLGESMIKRDLGVKDMGRLLPGHGGLMDRLDSLLPCAAVAYLLFKLALGS